MDKSHIVPLPVDIPESCPVRSNINRLKIVSVARLVEFKNYHPPVIEFVAAQRRKGVAFEYHIYGDGPLAEEVRALVVRLGVERFVHLHGSLAYDKMVGAICDAGIAVGMGTAVVEAAAQGIPAITAIEMRGRESHGWFHQTHGFDVGEQISALPRYSIGSLLADYSLWDDGHYRKAAVESWQRAGDFSSDTAVTRFIEIVEHAANVRSQGIRVSQIDWWRYWAAKVYARYFSLRGWLHK
jgi:hypothetical protein